MKILLFFPPFWDTQQPYLALPSLTAFLKKKQINVAQRDLNIEILDYILSPEYLGKAGVKAKRQLHLANKKRLSSLKKELSPKKRLSQVFLRSRELVSSLVDQSSIGKDDLVVEIGPGEGIITEELAKKARKVVAIERDPQLCRELQDRFRDRPNVEIHQGDALKLDMPDEPHKVFANPPFAIEGRLVRKLVNGENPPNDTYLVMRRGVAERMAGIPREGQFSVLHKPKFKVEIFHDFETGNFKPKPLVQSSMIRFKKREKPLVSEQDQQSFEAFVRQGFGGKGKKIKHKLQDYFSYDELNRLAQEYGFHVNDRPTDLTFNQWRGIFGALKKK